MLKQRSLQLQVTTRSLIFSFSLVLGCVGDPPCDRQPLLAQVAKLVTQMSTLAEGRRKKPEHGGVQRNWSLLGTSLDKTPVGDLFHDFSASLCSELLDKSINSQVINNQFCSFKHLCL